MLADDVCIGGPVTVSQLQVLSWPQALAAGAVAPHEELAKWSAVPACVFGITAGRIVVRLSTTKPMRTIVATGSAGEGNHPTVGSMD